MFPLFTAFSASSYYNLILAYSFYFLYKSFSSPLPWKVDDDSAVPWNSVSTNAFIFDWDSQFQIVSEPYYEYELKLDFACLKSIQIVF